jgi:hypothetical protein
MDRFNEGRLMEAVVGRDGNWLIPGTPKPLFVPGYVNAQHINRYHTFAVSRDGERFVIPLPEGASAPTSGATIVVMVNWPETTFETTR